MIFADQTPKPPATGIYTVSGLARVVRGLLEDAFPQVSVEGEISNLARPASGHLYFSLKDTSSQIRCAMFRGRGRLLRFTPQNGQQVVVSGRISLYTARGDFQLIAERMEAAGEGDLRRAFEELKLRLEQEGLFAASRKSTIPRFPRRPALITSASGAALRDVLQVAARRSPATPLLLIPVTVQGARAVPEIVSAISRANDSGLCDVLLLTRGGGSLEDLQAFNDESVARAISASRLPVVTGVGHETDFTIADFVADLRAPTPSAAAELITPDRRHWLQTVSAVEHRLRTATRKYLHDQAQALDWLERHLNTQHPGKRLLRHRERLRALGENLQRGWRFTTQGSESRLQTLAHRLERVSPQGRIQQWSARHREMEARLVHAFTAAQGQHARRLELAGRGLDAVSPLSTLQRGYAVITREADAKLVTQADQVAPGERIRARLANGVLICNVEETGQTGNA